MSDGLTEAVDRAVATLGLARVDADHPAAVLLVDLDSADVVYANELAAQLAPDVRLPTNVGAWSRAARLQDSSGAPLDDTATPLNRVAGGSPVRGEHVTARRESDVSEARESMWVVGMPLLDAPAPLDRRALVVFLPLRDHEGVEQIQQAGHDLQHRAVVSSEVSFSISDPLAPDDPLVWVNPAFEAITGYRGVDVVGTNCRFLQGPHTDPAAIARIREGVWQPAGPSRRRFSTTAPTAPPSGTTSSSARCTTPTARCLTTSGSSPMSPSGSTRTPPVTARSQRPARPTPD